MSFGRTFANLSWEAASGGRRTRVWATVWAALALGCATGTAPAPDATQQGSGSLGGPMGPAPASADPVAPAVAPEPESVTDTVPTAGSEALGQVPIDLGPALQAPPVAPEPKPQPGVIIVDGAPAARRCAALCQSSLDPAANPDGDDWGYENGVSCILPKTASAENQACLTLTALPEPEPRTGVVVLDGATGNRSCVAQCRFFIDPAADPEGDDWAYENNDSCIIPGTITATNQSCTTLSPVPAPEPRPGIILVLDTDSSCVPLCIASAGSSDPDNPDAADWAYENNSPCVLPGSATTAGRRSCRTLEYPPAFVPPVLPRTVRQPGFFIQNGRLRDAYGNDFVIRGVGNAHAWFDPFGEYLAFDALDEIAGYGTNTVRVVWETTGGTGAGGAALPPPPASLLAEVLERIVALNMVPMLELHDASGLSDTASLLRLGQYFLQPDVKQVLLDFRQYLLINIANEWSGTNNYRSAYQQVIALLRNGGIDHTLIIDAPGFGQIFTGGTDRPGQIGTWLTDAAALLQGDPRRNLMFSVHMYGYYPTQADVNELLNRAELGASIPFLIGEFGWIHSGVQVDWVDIVQRAQQRGFGYIAWSWAGNSPDIAQLDMVEDWGGPLTPWGRDVLARISEQAIPASLFE